MARQLKLAGALGTGTADRRLDILRRVGQSGSISQAAREAGVSYKAAWQALDMLSNLAGVPLVERTVGGSGGGGARLTPAAVQLLEVAGEMARSREQVLARAGALAPGAGALALRTSMRNQLPCRVDTLQATGALVQVTLVLGEAGVLRSRITAESAQLLGLAPGMPVLALCKATAVTVARAGTSGRRPAANTLQGKASRVLRGEGGDEIGVQLPGGLQLVGFSAAGAGLRAGSRVALRVDESAVVIALAG